MYQAGQQVVYAAHGVCKMLCVEERVVDKKPVSYYVLQPLEQPDSRYYVPSHNQNAVAKMRPLMQKQALMDLLTSESIRKDVWIPDENRRKQHYRELIASLDPEALICMVHSLRVHKAQLAQSGKKFHLCDENFLRDAKKLLSTELSVVLEIPREEVDQHLRKLIEE